MCKIDDRRTVNAVAVQLEAGVVQNEINPTTFSSCVFAFHSLDDFPKAIHVVAENVLLGLGKSFTTCRLQGLDLLFGHVNE